MRRMSLEMMDLAEQAYTLYCKYGSASEVAEILYIAPSTVSSWRRQNDWDNRKSKLVAKIQESTDNSLEETTKSIIHQIDSMIDDVFSNFNDSENGSKLDMAKAMSELVRTRSLLQGNATSRVESTAISANVDFNKMYSMLSRTAPKEIVIDTDPDDSISKAVRPEDEDGVRSIEASLKKDGIVLEEGLVEDMF